MAGFIEVHPRNAFQSLSLVNVDDIMYVYQLAGDANEKWTVIGFQGVDLKPIDVEESYEVSQASHGNTLAPAGLKMVPAQAGGNSLRGTAQ
jgi:hypothetical protein